MNHKAGEVEMKRSTLLCTGLYVVLSILVGPLAPSASADGGFITSYYHSISEPTQMAFIKFDSQLKRQQMIIQPGIETTTPDFAWIIPVPALPEIDTENGELFRDCYYLTKPINARRDESWGCDEYDSRVGGVMNPGDGGVTIYDEEQVGIYNTITVGATEAGQLSDSLTVWGYLHETNRTAIEEALQYYIDKEPVWYFVAIQIDSSEVVMPNEPYWTGAIEPVSFTFDSETPIYPMRISAISAPQTTELLLYISADHRMTFPGAQTEYSNRLSGGEYHYIANRYSSLTSLISENCYLTKLRQMIPLSEMENDILITRAPTDNEFRPIGYSQFPMSLGILLLISAAMTVRAKVMAKRRLASPARSR
jgi:hypothetical protein